MTPDEARRLAKYLQHGWPGEFTEEALLIYLDALKPLPVEPVVQAVKGMLLTRTFRPTIAEIYEGAVLQLGGCAPTLAEALDQARRWTGHLEQLQWANGSGWSPPPPEAHPLVVQCCGSMAHTFDEHSFRRAYLELAENHNAERMRSLRSGQAALESGA